MFDPKKFFSLLNYVPQEINIGYYMACSALLSHSVVPDSL